MERAAFGALYAADLQQHLRRRLNVVSELVEPGPFRLRVMEFRDLDVLLTGWGAPLLDEKLLAALPNLAAVFHAGGTLQGIATEAAFARGVRFFSALEPTNSPVAEYTAAQVILALKRVWPQAQRIRTEQRWVRDVANLPGAFQSVVGLVSCGRIGRDVLKWMRHLEVRVLVCDPAMSAEDASQLGVGLVGLDALFAQADVVTCHAPWLPTTERMIRGHHFASMKPGATFINTSRGAVVAEDEMCQQLATRPDLTAVLDVTWPEPPPPGSPLFTLPNVLLTPHLAGCVGQECLRNGAYIMNSISAWLRGDPPIGEVSVEEWRRMGRSR